MFLSSLYNVKIEAWLIEAGSLYKATEDTQPLTLDSIESK